MTNPRWLIALCLFALLGLPAISRGQRVSALPAEVAAKLDQAMQAEMKSQEVVGMAVGLIADNQLVYAKGFGWADRAKKTPVTRSTMFRWASISKPLTAIAALQLAEQGKLDLDADVRKYVPEFPDKGRKITARQLICHQSGIVHYSNGRVIRTKREYQQAHPFEDVVVALDTFRESPLIADPGEKFSYSTHAYILLSAVVQRAGKQKFADQVRERIRKPLAMKTLQPDYQWLDIPNRTKGYYRLAIPIFESSNTDVSWKLGGGGFISNIDDLAALATGLLERKLLSEKSYELIATPQKNKAGQRTPVGLGLFVSGEGQDLKLFHSGSQEKTRTRMVIYPRRRLGAVVMCNSHHAKPSAVSTKLLSAFRAASSEKDAEHADREEAVRKTRSTAKPSNANP